MEIQHEIRYIVCKAKQIDNAYMIIEEPDFVLNGIRLRFWFSNHYGASVVKQIGSYGYKDGLWELAVLYGNEDSYTMAQRDDITGDDTVAGWLTVESVIDKIKKISEIGRK